MANADNEAKTNRKILVTDLFKLFTAKEVREYFSKYGTVTDVTILEPSRTSAFVTFDSPDASRAVLDQKLEHKINTAYNPHRVFEAISKPTDDYGSECEIAPIATQGKAEDARCESDIPASGHVVAEGLPRTTTSKDIRRWFSKFGTIIDVSRPSRHLAIIEFETRHMAQSLLEQEGKFEINGTVIHLTLLPFGNDGIERIKEDKSVEFITKTNSTTRTANSCDPADCIDGMRDTLRLIKSLAPARGHASSMMSLYLNNGDSSPDDASIDELVDKLTEELESHQKYRCEPSPTNSAATQESFNTIKKCLQSNGTIPRRGRVIFCGTVYADSGDMRQVLIEFEPYTLISDKSFCYFDNEFHLGPLAFKLINYQMSDGLGASDFKKVSEVLGDDLQEMLAEFNIDAEPKYRNTDPILLDSFHFFGQLLPYDDILQEVRVAEMTRILRLIESLRVSGGDKTKKMILFIERRDASDVTKFLTASPDLEEARNPHDGSSWPLSIHAEGWHNVARQLLEAGTFPGDVTAKRCFEFAEERVNLYSKEETRHGLLIYFELGMSLGGREMKFSVEIEPRRHVLKNRVIYIPNGHFDLGPLEELVLLEDDLVPFALDPKNAPPGIMSHEKRDLLIRLVEELASKPIIAQPLRTPASWPIVSATRRLAKKARGVFKRMFNRSSQPDNDSSMFECAQL